MTKLIVNKELVTQALNDSEKSLRSIRDSGISRAAYNELSRSSAPNLKLSDIVILARLLNKEPLRFMEKSSVRNLVDILPTASEMQDKGNLETFLVPLTDLETIKASLLDSAGLATPSLDISSRVTQLSSRAKVEWEGISGTGKFADSNAFNKLNPGFAWISLLPDDHIGDISESLLAFQSGLEGYLKTKTELSDRAMSLDQLIAEARKRTETNLIEEYFSNGYYQIYHKRIDRPLYITEHKGYYDETGTAETVSTYSYELQPLVSRHFFIVAPPFDKNDALILRASVHSEATIYFNPDFQQEPMVGNEQYEKHSVRE